MILYYPFILLVIATVLIMVDQPFVLKLFKSVSLEEMWRLVVVESDESPHIQRQRLQHAMSVSSSGYFISYLSRTLLSLVLSLLPISLLSLSLTDLDSGVYRCQLYDYNYECAGIPAELYKVPPSLLPHLHLSSPVLWFVSVQYRHSDRPALLIFPPQSLQHSLAAGSLYGKTAEDHEELQEKMLGKQQQSAGGILLQQQRHQTSSQPSL